VTYPPDPLPLGLREGGIKFQEGFTPLLDAPFGGGFDDVIYFEGGLREGLAPLSAGIPLGEREKQERGE